MSVFVVRHQHRAGRCPAADFTAGAGLLNHLSGPGATRHGVRIRGEAVLAAHTLLVIAEADGEDVLRAFLRPFEAAGTVQVEPASTCAQAVAVGGCGSALPVGREVRAVDPEQACTAVLAAGLVVRRAYPLDCETPLPAVTGGVVMPGWYAVASVKWLTDIELTGRPFGGYFQVDRYHIGGEPVSISIKLHHEPSVCLTHPSRPHRGDRDRHRHRASG
jgi:hypothetical protein